MNIKQELLNGLREIREELGSEVLVEYTSGERSLVPAIVYNQEFELGNSSGITLEKRLQVNILVEDLKDRGLPVKGFKSIRWKLVDYVPKANPLSSWEQVITLDCSIFGVMSTEG